MKVIDHKQGTFFLLHADDGYFLDVLCNRSFASYTITIQLNEAEGKNFETAGISYVEKLANAINNTQDNYVKRPVDSARGQQIHNAIMEWNAENPRD